jgi:hypothetical protein
MHRKAARRALAACALAALGWMAACHESTKPVALSLQLGASSRLDSLDVSDTTAVAESAYVTVGGDGAAAAAWTASHGGAPWLSLVRASGTGSGWVVWRRDASWIGYGVSVDTITVRVPQSTAAASLVDSVSVRQLPALVTIRRAWLPGERDSLVARMLRDSLDGLFVPAAVAELLAASDSVTVVEANPALAAAGRKAAPGLIGSASLGQSGQTWIMVGYQLRELYPITQGSSTMDSIDLLGVIWYASPESTWKGRALAATAAATIGKTTVNTAAFDSTYETSGAGAAEARGSLGEYWQANQGQLDMTSNYCSPSSCADASFPSGPWQGGVWHGMHMAGDLISIVAPCILPAGCSAPPDTFSVNFRSPKSAQIAGMAITCIFPSPCTGPAAARIARLARRRASLSELPGPIRPEPPLDGRARAARRVMR